MKPLIVTLLLACCAGVAPAQTQEALETAPDVVVGTVAASDCTDKGTLVSCRATVRVLRAIKGGLVPQGDVQVHWDYRPGPFDGPETTRHVPDVTALWFLRPAGEGAYTPVQVTLMSAHGGVFLRVPAEPPGGDFFYANDVTPDFKIACEVGAALVADDSPASLPITLILTFLPVSATAHVYASLSRSPSAALEAVGISGRLRAGDASAVIELDRDLPRLADTSTMGEFAVDMLQLKLRDQPEAARALAHLALSEIEVPLLERFAPVLLASTGDVEFLPALFAMLQSPSPGVPARAVFGACMLLRSREAAMRAHCPRAQGEAVQQEETQEESIRFWIEWWQTGRTRDPQLAALHDAPLPLRYGRAQAPRPQPMEMPMTERLFRMMHMIPPATPTGSMDLFSSRMSAEDHSALLAVLKGVNEKLEAIDEDGRKMTSGARFTAGPPDLKQVQAFDRRRTDALQSGIAGLQEKLSPGGWAVVDKFLREMEFHVGAIGGQQ